MELIARNYAITTNFAMFYKTFKFILPPSICTDNSFKKITVCYYSTKRDAFLIEKCYRILGVANGSDQETVRKAFVDLVKVYHPDSKCPNSDPDRFKEIESAYRKLQEKFAHDRWHHNDCVGEYGLYYVEKHNYVKNVQEQDIEHTAPQHRQYLSYDGYGSGTQSQREKQYQMQRAETAVNNIYNFRVNKIQSESVCTEEEALVVRDKRESKKIKTRYGIDRLVEDLIQESMARGEFNNLPGQGKPLGRQYDHHNPYVDLVTHKVNQVLIDNGFKPEWITLEKDIKDEHDKLIDKLEKIRSRLGKLPLNEEDELIWIHSLQCLEDKVKKHNKEIDKYNLVVPLLTKQKLQFDLKKESERVLMNSEPKPEDDESNRKSEMKHKETTLFDTLFAAIFR